ncbi:MAG: hypothetical protein WBO04_01950 [Steroidobacteraceae bacterium]
MMTPLYKYGFFGDETSLVLAFVLGLGFGCALERAGFGSARKLAAQFYLHDMSVFKVMFTAVVTAMLGVGFVVDGYCPGTSLAALATGRSDAVLYALGIFAGTFVYAEVYPWIKGFVNSGAMGQVTLPEVFDLPWGLVVFVVVVIAVVGFSGATLVERRYGGEP